MQTNNTGDAGNNTTNTNPPAAGQSAAGEADKTTTAANAANTNNPAADSNAAPKTPGWMAQLRADLKTNSDLAKYENVNDLCTELLDARGRLANVLPLLPKDATEEQKAEFFNKLGRPEKPEGYTFEKPTLPEGMVFDDNLESFFRPLAHAAGYTQDQFVLAANAITNYNIMQHKKMVEATQKSVENYTRAWGDQATANFEKIHRVAEKIGSESFMNLLERAECDGVKFGNHPAVVDMMMRLHGMIGEDQFVNGGGSGGGSQGNGFGGPTLKYD